jgi:hypothetical protein
MNEDFITKLRKARALIEQDGWVQGTYYSLVTGCYCAQGAMTAAGIQEASYRLQVGRRIYGKSAATAKLINWNDAKNRTKEEVIAMFDNSIAALQGYSGRTAE